MCGIVGYIGKEPFSLANIVEMNREAIHRGPDGEGYWLWQNSSSKWQLIKNPASGDKQKKGNIVLGHRRLAILDLSEAGSQPMPSSDKKLWIVFNGEVYNYVEIKERLKRKGHYFRTKTDTEVILAAYKEWDTDCFKIFNGMWAMAIVDLEKNIVVLSRDRLGIKPLHYWSDGKRFLFASEIKQLLKAQFVPPIANKQVVISFIKSGYKDDPLTTFFKGIYSLKPGCWLQIGLNDFEISKPEKYWFPESIEPGSISAEEAGRKLREMFSDSVKIRLRADVPVGVSLSGGIDSTSIFSQVNKFQCGVEGFSAVFHSSPLSEDKYIEKVIKYYRAKCNYICVTADDFLADLDSFVFHQDEPTITLSPYAHWKVMKLARNKGIKVLLNGQGADELFGGYWTTYYAFLKKQKKRTVLRHGIGALLPGGNNQLIIQFPKHFRKYLYSSRNANLDLISASQTEEQKNHLVEAIAKLDPEKYRLLLIETGSLPGILQMDDRNSMAFGVETRHPFLDYRLVELALGIRMESNFDRGWNKLLIRKSLEMPLEIRWRKSKIGFETPQNDWVKIGLRNMLKNWPNETSDLFKEFVDIGALQKLASDSFKGRDEQKQRLFVRLFLLDRWMKIFKVSA